MHTHIFTVVLELSEREIRQTNQLHSEKAFSLKNTLRANEDCREMCVCVCGECMQAFVDRKPLSVSSSRKPGWTVSDRQFFWIPKMSKWGKSEPWLHLHVQGFFFFLSNMLTELFSKPDLSSWNQQNTSHLYQNSLSSSRSLGSLRSLCEIQQNIRRCWEHLSTDHRHDHVGKKESKYNSAVYHALINQALSPIG